jgi:hypothetical protein
MNIRTYVTFDKTTVTSSARDIPLDSDFMALNEERQKISVWDFTSRHTESCIRFTAYKLSVNKHHDGGEILSHVWKFRELEMCIKGNAQKRMNY